MCSTNEAIILNDGFKRADEGALTFFALTASGIDLCASVWVALAIHVGVDSSAQACKP